MKKSFGLLCFMFLSSTAHAGYSISAGFGKNFTNSVQTEEDLKIELEDDSHFTVSLIEPLIMLVTGSFIQQPNLI